jgi:amino acid transporter
MSPIKKKGKKKANANTKTSKKKRSKPRGGRRKPHSMIGVLSVVFLGVFFFVALGFAFHYYGKDGQKALWWGVASAICAIVGVGLYIQQFVILAKPQTEGVSLSQKEADRAWLVVKAVQLKNTLNSRQPPIAQITFLNSGKTPAIKAKFWYVLIANETEWRYSNQPKSPGTLQRGGADHTESNAVIPPNVEYSAETGWERDQTITDSEMRYIIDNKLRFYVSGIIKYEDVFGRPHETEFCFVNTSPDSVTFAPCGKYNTVS